MAGLEGDSCTEAIRDGVLQELCEAKRSALLATPYLSFDTRFLGRDGSDLLLWATMSQSVAENTLSEQSLRIRFPWNLEMWSGATKILGFEQEAGRRILRVAVPTHLVRDESRQHWRNDRCGKSTGSLANQDLTVVRVSLENLSQSGAFIFSSEPLDLAAFGPGHQAALSYQLEGGVKLQSGVRIVHGDAFRMGLAFHPPLRGEALERLSAWLKPRFEEAKRVWQNRSELRAQAVMAAAVTEPEGILLVAANPEIEAQIRPLLEGLPELRLAPPVISGLKKALTPPPRLVLLHLPQSGLEERRRYRMLVDALPDCPLVLLSTPQGTALAQELGAEFKALTVAWNPSLGAFLKRLVVGLLKKHSA